MMHDVHVQTTSVGGLFGEHVRCATQVNPSTTCGVYITARAHAAIEDSTLEAHYM